MGKEEALAGPWFAHSREGQPQATWQGLAEHLHGVAGQARDFAGRFGAGEWGALAGLFHDAGKYTEAFQRRLAGDGQRVDHSSAGARLAVDRFKGPGKLLAYCIAGHHAGLPDGRDNDLACLTARLKTALVPDPARTLADGRQAPGAFPFTPALGRTGFQCAFFIRMLYSCLVDADFLDTEAFLDQEKHAHRGGYPTLATMWERLTAHLAQFAAKAEPSPVDPWRAKVLGWCLAAAGDAPGLFSLTVPTGGGKTLSSLAFALKHAITHDRKQVIYVIPYTSIIEQNAEVFRKAVGLEAVVEHHSNYDPRRRTDKDAAEPCGDEGLGRRHELAAENWDAPLVVTTSVQFFESLFANRSSRCRKLHNITRSVVILDEAQMLPPALLRPCLEALRELHESYGATVVLCTATQPALNRREGFAFGLEPPREIVADVPGLFGALKRTRVVHLGKLTDDGLVERLREHGQVLCVVNTRAHARRLHALLGPGAGGFHLSASMCPAHRSEKLAAIRAALKAGQPCRVVSTQLIECGVDVSFPAVYRAEAGVDSVAQAAGRCNREGELEEGVVYVFEAADMPPPKGEISRAAQVGVSVMHRFADVLSPEAVEAYFQELYWLAGDKALDASVWDVKEKVSGIFDAFQGGVNTCNFPFRKVGEAFRFIESIYRPVIIPWDEEGEAIVEGLQHAENVGRLARRAQRYTVQIPPWEFAALEKDVALTCLRERFYVLTRPERYDDEEGLSGDAAGVFRAEDWIQ
uniref:CRISPR-associated endonuclease Cas3-HD n=1 Tax=Desulfovibrio sp. U5L TaxID=596152 RepID=I2Q4C7_9BACT